MRGVRGAQRSAHRASEGVACAERSGAHIARESARRRDAAAMGSVERGERAAGDRIGSRKPQASRRGMSVSTFGRARAAVAFAMRGGFPAERGAGGKAGKDENAAARKRGAPQGYANTYYARADCAGHRTSGTYRITRHVPHERRESRPRAEKTRRRCKITRDTRDIRDTRDTRDTRDECLKGWDAPVARRAKTGGTPVPEQGGSRSQWAPGAMGGAAMRSKPIEEP